MKHEVDVSWPLLIRPDEVLVSGRTFALRIARQHTLQSHADAFHIVHRTPSGLVEEVEADDSVRVDMRVYGDRVSFVADEDDFGCLVDADVSMVQHESQVECGAASTKQQTHLYRIAIAESELQPIHVALVYRVVVHANVHEPFLEVVGLDSRDTGREILVQLEGNL